MDANGAPGEVSNATLGGAGTLDTPFADPDDEALLGKQNELISTLRRL